MNKQYFNYLVQSRKNTVVFVAVLYTLLYAAVNIFLNSSGAYIDGLAVVTIVAFLLTYFLVCNIYSYVHNKKAVDSYFCLPVSRKEQLITSQVFIDLVIIVPVLILEFVTMIIILGYKAYAFNLMAFIIFALCFTISIITTTGFITTIYLQAYSVLDGVILIGAYLAIPLMCVLVMDNFIDTYVYGLSGYNYNIFATLTSIIYASGDTLINISDYFVNRSELYTPSVYYFICIIWHIAVSVYCLIKDYINRKVEKAENISNKISAYPFVIYFYAFALMFMATSIVIKYEVSEFVIIVALVFIAFEIANCVYRRKVKIYLKDVLFFIITTMVALSIGLISHKTDGFNLAWNYEKEPENVRYHLYEDYFNFEFVHDDLYDLVVSRYPDYSDYGFNFDCYISNDEMSKNSEIINYLENMRVDLITDYYENQIQIGYERYYGVGTLTIFNNLDEAGDDYYWGNNIVEYSYQIKNPVTLSLDDLKTLDKYGNLIISISTGYEWMEFKLSDLLNE